MLKTSLQLRPLIWPFLCFLCCFKLSASELILTELVSSNGTNQDRDGHYSDWVEITNISNGPVDLSNYYLTDKADEPNKWRFPEYLIDGTETHRRRPFTLAPGHSIVVFCSGKNTVYPPTTTSHPEYHTNFKLNHEITRRGEDIILLLNQHAKPLDGVYLPTLSLDQSFGRKTEIVNGELKFQNWQYIAYATPASANPVNYNLYSDHPFSASVKFKYKGGKVSGRVGVVINHSLKTGENLERALSMDLKMMINGDGEWREVPDVVAGKGQFFLEYGQAEIGGDQLPLPPLERHLFPNSIVDITPFFNEFANYEFFDFDQLITRDGYHIKVAGFIDDRRVTPEVSQSYFFGERSHALTLPIISFHMDEKDFQRLMHRDFRFRGRNYELKTHLNVIEPDGQLVYQAQAGFRLHGNVARGGRRDFNRGYWLQKGGKLYARRAHGSELFNHAFFANKGRTKFDQLILRSGHTEGPYWRPNHTVTRDQLGRDLFFDMGHLSPRGAFYHLYVNGRYRGLYNVHERCSCEFLNYYLGAEKCEIIKSSAEENEQPYEVVDGTQEEKDNNQINSIEEIMAFLNNGESDFDNPDDYAWLAQRVDIDNLLDYHLLNTFINNRDWVGGVWNFMAYRVSRPNGKWRFMPWDLEYSWRPTEVASSEFRRSISASHGSAYFIRSLIRGLWRSQIYQRAFIQRANELIHSPSGALSEGRLLNHHDSLWRTVRGDIHWQNHYYWPHWDPQWQAGMDTIANSIAFQARNFLEHIDERNFTTYLEVFEVTPRQVNLDAQSDNSVLIKGRGFFGPLEVYLDGVELEFQALTPYDLVVYLDYRQWRENPELTIARRDNGDQVSGQFFSVTQGPLEIIQASPSRLIVSSDVEQNRVEIRGIGLHEHLKVSLDGVVLPHQWVAESRALAITVPLLPLSSRPILKIEDKLSGEVVEGQFFELIFPSPYFLRGDANGDLKVDISDVITSTLHMFNGHPVPCQMALDSNGNNLLEIGDIINLAQFSFKKGPAPLAPFPRCGFDFDRRSHSLGCSNLSNCE